MRISLKPTIAYGVPLMLVAGCGMTTRYVALKDRAENPRAASEVEVFTAAPPKRAYEDIGYIESRERSVYYSHDTVDAIAEMRREAGKHGCEAIVVTDNATRAACIVFKSDEAEPVARPPKTKKKGEKSPSSAGLETTPDGESGHNDDDKPSNDTEEQD